METVFILTGSGILIGGILFGLLLAWLMARKEKKGRYNK